MVSHGNLMYNERMAKKAYEHTEQSTFVGWLPLYHDMGLIGNVLQPLYIGSRSILMPPAAFSSKTLPLAAGHLGLPGTYQRRSKFCL